MKYSPKPRIHFMKGTARDFIKAAILIWGAIFLVQPVYAERLYVFYPSVVRTQIMQKKLNQALPGIEIRVFGRYKDFKAKIKTDSPDAILSKVEVIKDLGDYLNKRKGIREDKTDESYVLLSVGKRVNPAQMASTTIGVFDILGRKGMKEFIGHYFRPKPRIKRVSKMEDLLQLLTFNMVDAILIPEIYVAYFKEISKLHFIVTPVPKMRVGIIALAIKFRRNTAQILRSFSSMNDNLKTLLDIDNWEVAQ
ncbi:secreted protein [Beggiatoa sp. PS]|nr:secreted protein [Beggiatoa sp. PS]